LPGHPLPLPLCPLSHCLSLRLHSPSQSSQLTSPFHRPVEHHPFARCSRSAVVVSAAQTYKKRHPSDFFSSHLQLASKPLRCATD
jgi:hypothetical protein